jgi:RimJ/RimL family protein N-acetyltransferase
VHFVTEKVAKGWTEDSAWVFAVEALDDAGVARFAGTVALRNEGDRRAEVAYGLHPWARGRGIAVRAVSLLLDWGFASRGLEVVIWWANRGNWASRRLAWQLGFSYDGMVRRWLPQRGQLLDAWVGSLVSGEPRRPRNVWYDVPRVVGDTVVLRPHRAGDVDRVVEACNDPETAWWLGRLPRPFTAADAAVFLATREEDHAAGLAVNWAVADKATDEVLGHLNLFAIERGRDCEVGYWTHPAARGRGVMTQACRLAARHALVDEADGGLGLRCVRALAATGNTASRRVLEGSGFTETGLARAKIPLGDGSLADAATYDLLLEDLTRRGR